MDYLFNNGTFYNIQYYTVSKILSKVIIAHFRVWRYIDVAYKSQYCKGSACTLIRSWQAFKQILEVFIFLKSVAEFTNSKKSIFYLLLRCVSIVRQLDSPTILNKIEKKMKIRYSLMLFESLCTVCISMFPPLIWKKIREI